MEKDLSSYHSLIKDLEVLIASGRKAAYQSINQAMIDMYWNIGKRIVEEEQKGKARAQYGKALIKNLAAVLTTEFGAGFTARNLTWTHFRSFLRFVTERILSISRNLFHIGFH